jgi:Fe-S cluster assembly protein SufD
MAATAERSFLDDFERLVPAAATEPGWLASLRRGAAERLGATGWPSRREEAWRFTPIGPIRNMRFAPAATDDDGIDGGLLDRLGFADSYRLVFVNGRLRPDLSTARALPRGVVAGSLAEALTGEPAPIEAVLGRLARPELHAFAALNAAYFTDGAFVLVPPHTIIERPIHLVFLAAGGESPTASLPRTLVLAGEESEAVVVESYAGSSPHALLVAPVTEIAVGAGARLRHLREQREASETYHLGTLAVQQARGSSVESHTISLGARLARLDIEHVLAGEGADATLNGLYLVDGEQHAGIQMTVEHAAPACTSRERYKGILDGRGSTVFNGLIVVHPGAQKTNAKQSNRNLLLSRQALANSNPQLRILADDVKCTHGSTVGQLDEDALFYLRSRGLDLEAARALLTYAFAAEVVEGIGVEAVRRELTDLLFGRLNARGGAVETP